MNIVRIASLSSSVLLAVAVAACSSDGTPSTSGGTSGTSGGKSSGGTSGGGTSGGGTSGGTSGGTTSGGTTSGGTSGSSDKSCSSAALNGRCFEGPNKGKSCCMPDDSTTCNPGTDCDTVCEFCK
jgi:hypothetical protein